MDKIRFKFCEKIYGIILIYDELDAHHADMCFTNFAITHSIH